jgi:uncharacterized protein
MKRRKWLAASAVLFGCAAAAHAYPARPEGPVLDLADVIPATDEAALNYRLSRYYEASGNALVVVTVTSLEGRTIEQYANGLFNEWGIGDAKTDRGILLLVAPSEHQARIEVGCGLEGTVTNGFAEQVMQSKMIPEYKQSHFEEGTLAAVDALINRLASTPANDNGPVSAVCRSRLSSAR